MKCLSIGQRRYQRRASTARLGVAGQLPTSAGLALFSASGRLARTAPAALTSPSERDNFRLDPVIHRSQVSLVAFARPGMTTIKEPSTLLALSDR
jgi:hypothetical protein